MDARRRAGRLLVSVALVLGGCAPDGRTSTADEVALTVGEGQPIPAERVEGTCLAGFKGFRAGLAGYLVELEAFIAEPGDYSGDPVKILYVSMTTPEGKGYCADAGQTTCPSTITLHAATVEPRLTGSLEALLVDQSDPAASRLGITMRFDVADHRDCK